MSESRRAFFYRETEGIRITVRPSYIRERSKPELGQYYFAYHIRIENVGVAPAQLKTRRWHIHDPIGGDNVVEGPGVIGEQPLLLPGEIHQYSSFCLLKAPTGWMEGTYRFVRNDGSSFHAGIPRFTLDAEQRSDTVS